MIFGEIAFQVGPVLNPEASSGGEALGPVKVLIVREIAEKDLASAKKYGLKTGCAYLQKGPTKYEYIKKVDT
ncbi:MAG: hypothetical protein PHQ54_05205 [Candidatus Omnitrophica bacterium]|nr:hypothetical protein [Candidatus Omnitrophota bacterium]